MSPAALATLHAAAMTVPRPWTAAEFAALLADPATLLACRPHGFALGRVVLDEAELLTLATDPGHRRRGIGRACLAAYETAAAARGAVRGVLEVAEDNAAARALYTAGGYAPCGRRPGYYRAADGRAVDALIYARPLGR
ncbi:GNAT family N-acetyltransferase [Rhodobacteraceae bacterium CCMM004]|nr:GNAT family N-acetyltransferase [Rhodobacteraceae bacterium CCMM004]